MNFVRNFSPEKSLGFFELYAHGLQVSLDRQTVEDVEQNRFFFLQVYILQGVVVKIVGVVDTENPKRVFSYLTCSNLAINRILGKGGIGGVEYDGQVPSLALEAFVACES